MYSLKKQSIIIFLSVLSIQLLAQPEGEILGEYEDWPSEVIEKYVVNANCGGNLEREVNVRITRKPYSEQGVSGKWYDTYVSVDMCPDLLFTKQLKFRYKIALDLMVTMDIWREGWITWEEDLKEIGKEFYLGRAGNGYYKLELELVCDDYPSEEKRALFNTNNGTGIAAQVAKTSTLLVKAEADCILKVDFKEVAQLKAGEGEKITIEAGEHIIEAYSYNNQLLWEQDLVTETNKQAVLRIQSNTKEDITESDNIGNTFTDSRDGKTYKTVKIGNQIWMAENLNYFTSSGYWCYDDNSYNCDKYGRLYNYETAKTVCPAGWHLPSKAEYELLFSNFGDIYDLYAALKDGGSSGFNALISGFRMQVNGFGKCMNAGSYVGFWSSTEFSVDSGDYIDLNSNTKEAGFNFHPKVWGFSVRCIRD